MKSVRKTYHPILLMAGLCLSLIFILNVALGNAIMNLIAFGLPLNQLLIGLLLVILAVFGLIKIPTGYASTLFYIWLLFGLFIWLPVGFLNHGIIAGRDATQLLDATALFLAFNIFLRMRSFSIVKVCEKILLLGLTLEFLDRVVLFQFSNVTVSSFVEVNVFGGTIGSAVIVTASFWFGIVMKNNITRLSSRYMILLSVLLVLLLQNRFLYVSMIATSIVYLFIARPSFLNKALLKKASVLIVLLIFFEIYVTSIVGSLLSSLPGSEYILSERLFKYGIESFSLTGIIELLGTGFGVENAAYSGAAGGLFLRFQWWYTLFSTMFSDSSTLLLGMGYGIPLTDGFATTIIREPHNSFISVFCRNGLILFFIWFIFHALVVFKSIRVLRKVSPHSFEYKLLLVSLLAIISTHICGLVEPAFELPPIAIPTYIFIGLSLVLLNRLKRFEKAQINT
jgi:hypothetical protein